MNDSINSRGFSLIEMLIAIVILSISLLALAGLMVTTTQNNSFGGHMTEAATFAQDRLEELKVTPWVNIAGGADSKPYQGTLRLLYSILECFNFAESISNPGRWPMAEQ